MSESKHGSAGGKARALLQKEEAKQRIDEYNQNPNLCLCCNKPILAPYDKKLQEMCEKPTPLGVGWIAQIMRM